MGALGLSGRAVLEALCEIVDDASGRLEPSIATIAEKAKLGIRTVVRALRRLNDHGFLSWLRRTEAIDNDGAGPQVQQVTNAYWFELRGRAAGLVRLLLGRAPPDAAQARGAAGDRQPHALRSPEGHAADGHGRLGRRRPQRRGEGLARQARREKERECLEGQESGGQGIKNDADALRAAHLTA
jgi:hypothetical protein